MTATFINNFNNHQQVIVNLLGMAFRQLVNYSCVTSTIVLSIPSALAENVRHMVMSVRTERNVVLDMIRFLHRVWIIPSGVLQFRFCSAISSILARDRKLHTIDRDIVV